VILLEGISHDVGVKGKAPIISVRPRGDREEVQLSCWMAPPEGWVKDNVDAGWDPHTGSHALASWHKIIEARLYGLFCKRFPTMLALKKRSSKLVLCNSDRWRRGAIAQAFWNQIVLM
jgi:hypothetical protein